jgi:hypothetical protein
MAPVLLSVTVADVGRAFYFREAVTNAARQAIRVAAQPAQKGAATSACAGTSGNVTVAQTTNIPDTGGGTAMSISAPSPPTPRSRRGRTVRRADQP